jgi:hypothetical protein
VTVYDIETIKKKQPSQRDRKMRTLERNRKRIGVRQMYEPKSK